jgi:hypothetical protein
LQDEKAMLQSTIADRGDRRMKKLPTLPKLLTQAAPALLMLAMVYPAYAGNSLSRSGTPIVHGLPDAPALLAAPPAKGMQAAGARGALPNPAASHPVAIVKPITAPSPIAIQQRGRSVNAPGLYDLQTSASSVTVKWYDTSDNELGFKVFRRGPSGNWQLAYQVATRDMQGSGPGTAIGGSDYTWVDTSTNISGQCYMIAAYNSTSTGDTTEQCTVRPDSSRFPQAVDGAAAQWSGLSDTNDGTGNLVNTNIEEHLLYGDQTFGVNLTYGDSSLWRVEAQGGPHLMKGQAVALKVWGGGWLKYGSQTWGVDLQLSDTPVYEWYAIGLQNDPSERAYAGYSLTDGGTFALWNSSAQAYLVRGYQTWGISLSWYKVGGGSPTPTPTPSHGVKTEQVLNCSVEQHPVEVFIADQTAGSGFVDKGTVGEQYGSNGCPAPGSVPLTFSPLSGHQYLLVATDKSLPACDGNDDPQEGACRKMVVQFIGDANGVTRTDIIDIGTQITP